jgi:hypothetical protein
MPDQGATHTAADDTANAGREMLADKCAEDTAEVTATPATGGESLTCRATQLSDWRQIGIGPPCRESAG